MICRSKRNGMPVNWDEHAIYPEFAISAIIFCGGIVQDGVARSRKAIFYVLAYAGVCLTVLSIQATVGTLVFTILSLLTGRMGQSTYGMSEIDFLLNIKPVMFKQKNIIVEELCLVCVGIGLQLFYASYDHCLLRDCTAGRHIHI